MIAANNALISSLLVGLVVFLMSQVYATRPCSSCGKRLVHADDCWRRRD
jgi:hypothetical protein